MKEVVVIRHAHWDLTHDQLTDLGESQCAELKPKLGSFAMVMSSPSGRAQQTATLLSDQEPAIDERAGVLKSPPELSAQVAKLRQTNPYGVAGAIISIPELRLPLQRQGEELKSLVEEMLASLDDGQHGLIVSHDGTMVALEKILSSDSFDEIDHTYGELEGYRIDDDLALTPLIGNTV